MEQTTLNQIQARIAELPEDVRGAIESAELGAKVSAIGRANELHVDQLGRLEDEILLVMLGFDEPTNLTSNIEKELGVSPEQAEHIVSAVGEQIFMPIRESLKKFAHEHSQAGKTAIPATEASIPSIEMSKNLPSPEEIAKTPEIKAADLMLSQKTVSIPAQKPHPVAQNVPITPKIGPSYKTDPYREPAE